LVVLKFDEMGVPVRINAFAIPLNQNQTRYLLAFQLLEHGTTEIAKGFVPAAVEDRVVIESHQGEIPAPTEECNVPSDYLG
jgi:hypothetical protein